MTQTSEADWAVLTVTESLPAAIEPLRLRREPAPSGTKAVLVGYPQDRAFAMTADRDCELREKIDAGRLLLHTCRGIKGYSGAPILVGAGGGEMQIAGIQIATLQSDGATKMIAVPAQAIWRQDSDEISRTAAGGRGLRRGHVCGARDDSTGARRGAVGGDPRPIGYRRTGRRLSVESARRHVVDVMAWLASEPFAIVIP